jgi:FAD/FMN-containing dehydrogenase
MRDTIQAMTEAVRGRVITPSDSDYDGARAVYNGMHDRRPRAVIQCIDSADVMAAVAAGRDGGLDLAIRGGGHSVPGFGTVDDGLVIDLSPMRNVWVDPVKKVAPPLPFVPEDRLGDLFCVLVTCWNGPPEEADKILQPLRDVAEVRAEKVEVMPFPALNSSFDGLVPKGMQHYWKADFVTELTDEAIAAHVKHGEKTPHVSSSMHLHPINGAVQRVGASENAFGHRDKNFAPVIAGIWSDPADNEVNIKWVKDYYAAIHPHSGSDGGYVNFMSSDDDHRAAANYGANYERLAAVKATYDPENLFHINQNIAPAKRG